MGCWNRSWFEAALSRQEGRRRVLKTQRNRVHLPNISVRAAVPRAAAGCSRAAAGDSSSIGGNGNTARGERRHRDINLPEAGIGRREPLYPSANHGHRWDCVWEQECSGPALGGAAHPKHVPWVTGVGRHQHGAPFVSPNTGDIRQLPRQLWVVSVAFLSAARGRKLPMSVRSGRDNPDRRSRGGTSTAGLFAWKSP